MTAAITGAYITVRVHVFGSDASQFRQWLIELTDGSEQGSPLLDYIDAHQSRIVFTWVVVQEAD